MINSMTINNVDGIHSIDINTDLIPLNDFEVTVNERTITNRQKSQAHGLWPTRSLRDGMEIHAEGDIFGESSSDYFTRRIDLITALFGDPNADIVPTDRKLGDLIIDFEGSTETWTCSYTISAWSAPLQGLSPSRSSFAVTFETWDPWFIGTVSGDRYYYS